VRNVAEIALPDAYQVTEEIRNLAEDSTIGFVNAYQRRTI
jgi:hypothetical protein